MEKVNEKEKLIYNELPVITFRWLKANDIRLEKESFDDTNIFNEDYILKGSEFVDKIDSLREINLPEGLKSYKGSNEDELLEIIKKAKHVNYIHIKDDKDNNHPKKECDVRFSYDLNDENLYEVNYIEAKKGETINFVSDYSGTSSKVSGTLNILNAQEGSTINIIRVNMLPFDTRNLDQRYSYVSDKATVNYISVDLGAKETIVNYMTDLKGTSASANLKGIYSGSEDRIIDLWHMMNHMGKETNSDMEIKGVLKDKAKKYFRGTLDFKKGSTKSVGSELESVILLDKTVKNVAVPLLLCGEDDVIGNHAASAGQINEDMLFYIMSRGFSLSEAKRLIVESSFRPTLDLIKDEDLKGKIIEKIHETIERVK